MTCVVLTYKGTASRRQWAEAQLRRLFPQAILTPKTTTLVEAQIDDSELVRLEAQQDWEVSRPTYAEIRKPAFNLKSARAKLSREV